MSLKFTNLRLLANPPGANELTYNMHTASLCFKWWANY